jgi:tetratricopeptide (TPR) repeat protein
MVTLDELEALLRRGEKEKALELIRNYKGISSQILVNEGVYFGNIREYSLSITYFALAEKIAEDDNVKEVARKNLAVSYYNQGTVYDDLKQHEKAVEDFGKAIELNPKYAEAYYNRGAVYDDLKQHVGCTPESRQ